MSESLTIKMKPRSGMTTTAMALVTGLRSQGIRAYLVVPSLNDLKIIPDYFDRKFISIASDYRCLTEAADVYVFDDVIRCSEAFHRLGEGDMLACARQRFIPFDDDIKPDSFVRMYLFEYVFDV